MENLPIFFLIFTGRSILTAANKVHLFAKGGAGGSGGESPRLEKKSSRGNRISFYFFLHFASMDDWDLAYRLSFCFSSSLYLSMPLKAL